MELAYSVKDVSFSLQESSEVVCLIRDVAYAEEAFFEWLREQWGSKFADQWKRNNNGDTPPPKLYC